MAHFTTRLMPADEVKGRNYPSGPSLDLGNLTVSMSEQHLREIVECGIDLLSERDAARLPGCDGGDLPPAERAA